MNKVMLLIIIQVAIFAEGVPLFSSLSNAGGRFVFGQVTDYQKDKFMLDTKTGALWRFVKDENNNSILEPIEYINYSGGGVKFSVLAPTYFDSKK